MALLPRGVRILVCTVRQDMRKSFDTLAAVARDVMNEEPQSGALFVFVGKQPIRVKVLWWDRNGYCLLTKRLHRALFRMPQVDGNSAFLQIDSEAFSQLLAGVEKVTSQRKTSLH